MQDASPIENNQKVDEIANWIDKYGSKNDIEYLLEHLHKKLQQLNYQKSHSLFRNHLLSTSETKILTSLEKIIKKPIPIVDDVYFSLGAVIKDGHVVELGLCDVLIKDIPTQINELIYLETLYLDVAHLKGLPEQIGFLHLSPFLSKSLDLRVYWK